MDYYNSPCLDTSQDQNYNMPPPNGEGAPRRPRRRSRPALILFLILIVGCSAALGTLRIMFPNQWEHSFPEWIQSFDSYHFTVPGDFFDDPKEFFQIPDHFFEGRGEYDWEYSTDSSAESTFTTIPRAELNANVRMQLIDTPVTPLSFQEIYDKLLPSIVSIQAIGSSGSFEGTGVVMTSDGYVITNHHIINGCSAANVVLSDGSIYEAKLVGSDVESDLAVLKIDAQDLTAAEFGSSSLICVGDTALAIGNPLGSDLFGTMTEGIISAINRDVNVDGYSMSLIQTTAALNPGNSGGALVNRFGQVIGITNMKMMSSYETIEGLGFAIPTVWAKEVVDTLLAQGAITGRPTIGFTCYAVTANAPVYNGHNSGICISTVTPNGPADQAGVLPGDVIFEANGHSLSTLEDLILVRDEAGVGGTLDLSIWRSGNILEVSVILVDLYELN